MKNDDKYCSKNMINVIAEALRDAEHRNPKRYNSPGEEILDKCKKKKKKGS